MMRPCASLLLLAPLACVPVRQPSPSADTKLDPMVRSSDDG